VNPNYVPAYANLGCALIEQGKYTFAQAHLEEAIKVNLQYAPAYNNLLVLRAWD
jgi:tetratricopeptide (TPR) repeat protein